MDRRMTFGRFQFYDEATLDQQIDPKPLVDEEAVKPNRNKLLPFDIQASLCKVGKKASLIDRLKEARSKGLMQLVPAIDSDPSQLLQIVNLHFVPLRLCARISCSDLVRLLVDHPRLALAQQLL